MPQSLVSDDGTTQVWEVTDAGGRVIGTNVTPTPGSPAAVATANRTTIANQAAAALATNAAYLNLGAPTPAQLSAQVAALTRQVDGTIRLLLDQLGATT